MRTLLRTLVVGIFIASAGFLFAQEPEPKKPDVPDSKAQPPTVQAVSLEVWKLPPGLVLLLGNRHTTISLLVVAPKATIVGLDDLNSKVACFRDDVGTNLLKNELEPGAFAPSGVYSLSLREIGDGGHAALIDLSVNDTPATDAHSLSLQGEFILKIGVDLKTVDQPNVVLQSGESIRVGPKPMDLNLDEPTLVHFNKQNANRTFVNFEAEPARFLLQHEPALLEKVNSLVFLDTEGRSLSARRERFYSDIPDPEANFLTYSIASKPGDRLTVRVVYYDQIETLRVPFHIKTGLGL